jgi:hypothetical protein
MFLQWHLICLLAVPLLATNVGSHFTLVWTHLCSGSSLAMRLLSYGSVSSLASDLTLQQCYLLHSLLCLIPWAPKRQALLQQLS